MSKKSILLLLFIFCLNGIFAQKNFKKGYIISNTNDTTEGYIDFRTNNINSKTCRFKINADAPEQAFAPGEIYAFRFTDDGKYYVSKKITIEGVEHHVFLEYLVQGIKNLYYYPLNNGYYFFENNDGSMTGITKLDDVITYDLKVKEDKKYVGQLADVFKDCLPIATNTSQAEFGHRAMIKLTQEYHDKMCDTGERCILFTNDYKRKFISFTTAAYSGFEYNHISTYIYELPNMQSTSAIVGADLGFSSPRLLKPLWYMLDFNVSRLAGSAEKANYSTNTLYKYDFSTTKLNYSFGLKYIFENDKINWFLSIKTAKTKLINLNSTLKENYISYLNKNETDVRQNEKFPSFMQHYYFKNNPYVFNNIIFGAGCELKPTNKNCFLLEVDYIVTPKSIDNLNTIQCKLGYRINFEKRKK